MVFYIKLNSNKPFLAKRFNLAVDRPPPRYGFDHTFADVFSHGRGLRASGPAPTLWLHHDRCFPRPKWNQQLEIDGTSGNHWRVWRVFHPVFCRPRVLAGKNKKRLESGDSGADADAWADGVRRNYDGLHDSAPDSY